MSSGAKGNGEVVVAAATPWHYLFRRAPVVWLLVVWLLVCAVEQLKASALPQRMGRSALQHV